MTSVKELCSFLNICGEEQYTVSVVGSAGAVIHNQFTSRVQKKKAITNTLLSPYKTSSFVLFFFGGGLYGRLL